MTDKTTEALKSIRAILAEPDDEETISKIREALAKCKPAPDGRIPKTVFALEDIGKAFEDGRKSMRCEMEALAEQEKQEPKKWVDLTNEEYEMLCQGNAPMNIRVRTVAMALKHKNQGD